ncbi:MAG: DUF3144 domain-containing protein [Halieaceae bacterium]|jgi:hypothetical protein|nr:DUF3144 domain-containing protein [Halieaceae bacterium]
MSEIEQHQQAIKEFIDTANKMKDRGISVKVVSSAMMTANAVYASYSVAGNEGALTDSGIEKVTKAFAEKLAQVRQIREAEAAAKGAVIQENTPPAES